MEKKEQSFQNLFNTMTTRTDLSLSPLSHPIQHTLLFNKEKLRKLGKKILKPRNRRTIRTKLSKLTTPRWPRAVSPVATKIFF